MHQSCHVLRTYNEYDVQLFYTHSCSPPNNRLDRLPRQRKRAANVQCFSPLTCLLCINIAMHHMDAFEGMKRATCLRFKNFHLILYEQCSTNRNGGDYDDGGFFLHFCVYKYSKITSIDIFDL